MKTITVRDIPDEVHAALEARAIANHRSVQGEVMSIFTRELASGTFAAASQAIIEAVKRLAGHAPTSVSTILIPWTLALDLCKATSSEWPAMSERLLFDGPNALNGQALLGFTVRVDPKATAIFFV